MTRWHYEDGDLRIRKLVVGGLEYPAHRLETTIGAERPHLQEWIDRGW